MSDAQSFGLSPIFLEFHTCRFFLIEDKTGPLYNTCSLSLLRLSIANHESVVDERNYSGGDDDIACLVDSGSVGNGGGRK